MQGSCQKQLIIAKMLLNNHQKNHITTFIKKIVFWQKKCTDFSYFFCKHLGFLCLLKHLQPQLFIVAITIKGKCLSRFADQRDIKNYIGIKKLRDSQGLNQKNNLGDISHTNLFLSFETECFRVFANLPNVGSSKASLCGCFI